MAHLNVIYPPKPISRKKVITNERDFHLAEYACDLFVLPLHTDTAQPQCKNIYSLHIGEVRSHIQDNLLRKAKSEVFRAIILQCCPVWEADRHIRQSSGWSTIFRR
jgi:hypothetical protein